GADGRRSEMIIDSHCHFSEFGNLRETLRTALAHGVWGVVAVGCDAETNARTLAAAAAAPKSVWACLGFHPDWTQLTDEDLDLVAAQIAVHHSRIVGLGEVGLPWYSLEGRADAAALMARGRARLDRLLRLASRVAEEVAKLKQLPADDVIHQLSTNACRLFDLVWA